MYANFYYHKPSKTYGRGPWLDDNGEVMGDFGYDPLEDNEDCHWIGNVYDEKLFPNELVIET